MSNILYSKLKLSVPEHLDSQTAIITGERGITKTLSMTSPITDIILPGMEKYRLQAGDNDEEFYFGFGQIHKINVHTFYTNLKNATEPVSEDDWLGFVNTGGIERAVLNNETSFFIGKVVTVNNNTNSTTRNYPLWTIADFNHDGTTNTCDLINNNTVYTLTFASSSQYYNNSNLRSWLINTYYNGFSVAAKNKLVTMNVYTVGGSTVDKVKALSVTEVGASHSWANVEGTKYPIFTSSSGTASDDSRIRTGSNTSWWLRTYDTKYTDKVWEVNPYGMPGDSAYTSSYGVVPCIRFSNI